MCKDLTGWRKGLAATPATAHVLRGLLHVTQDGPGPGCFSGSFPFPHPSDPSCPGPHCPFLASSPLPGENFQQRPTQTGPPSRPWPLPPSHQPGPKTADGAENMASGTAAGALAAGRGVYIDLSPGTPGEGWPAGSGCQGQPILAPQGLIIAENGPCCAGQAQGTGVGS